MKFIYFSSIFLFLYSDIKASGSAERELPYKKDHKVIIKFNAEKILLCEKFRENILHHYKNQELDENVEVEVVTDLSESIDHEVWPLFKHILYLLDISSVESSLRDNEEINLIVQFLEKREDVTLESISDVTRILYLQDFRNKFKDLI